MLIRQGNPQTLLYVPLVVLAFKLRTNGKSAINISKWTLATRFSQHPSVPTCDRVLLAGTSHPLP